LEHAATIRSELENYIKSQRITLQRLADNSQINAGTLSAILHSNRPIALRQLDRLTEGMGLPEGTLYELYERECLTDHNPNWRRLSPFLHRCAQLNKLDCITRVTSAILDNLAYIPLLFETAEYLFQENRYDAARILYECVAESERYQHSERLAVCQFRMFTMAVGSNQQANLRATVRFEDYADKLCEEDQLDALRQLANVHYTLRHWDRVYDIAIEMGKKAEMLYSSQNNQKSKKPFKKTARPIFYYIFYSYLLQGSIHFEHHEYEQALHYLALYADTSWVIEHNETDTRYKKRFETFAKANGYLYKIKSGDMSVLPDYVAYMMENKNEWLVALMSIVEAANRNNYDIDNVLQWLDDDLQELGKLSDYDTHLNEFRYIKLYLELANYYFQRNRYEAGIQMVMVCLKNAVKDNNVKSVITCVALFEKYRQYASQQEIECYQSLSEEIQRRSSYE
jgi:transcriptional regulator with XRE-family HTH domain